jgi:transposase
MVKLVCCFEAGRDGFWLHRLLSEHGVCTYVVEPTSILVNRRARRATTDRLDTEGLLRVLANYVGDDQQVCSLVRVPTPEEEDALRLHREREHLVQERTRLENRILALLATQGIRERLSLRSWDRDLAALQTGDRRAIPPPAERSLAYSKQFRRLHLAQFRPLRPAKHILKTHPTYPLVRACPVHTNLRPRRPNSPDISRATNTGHATS